MQTYQKKPRYLSTNLEKLTGLNYLSKNVIKNLFMLDQHIHYQKFKTVIG